MVRIEYHTLFFSDYVKGHETILYYVQLFISTDNTTVLPSTYMRQKVLFKVVFYTYLPKTSFSHIDCSVSLTGGRIEGTNAKDVCGMMPDCSVESDLVERMLCQY